MIYELDDFKNIIIPAYNGCQFRFKVDKYDKLWIGLGCYHFISQHGLSYILQKEICAGVYKEESFIPIEFAVFNIKINFDICHLQREICSQTPCGKCGYPLFETKCK